MLAKTYALSVMGNLKSRKSNGLRPGVRVLNDRT